MSNNAITDRRVPLAKQQRQTDYSMDDFRAEMRRRIAAAGDDIARTPNAPSRRRMKKRSVRTFRARHEPTWREFCAAIVEAARRKLALLEGKHGHAMVSCPWKVLEPCTEACRCKGTGDIRVAALRKHYTAMANEYRELAR